MVGRFIVIVMLLWGWPALAQEDGSTSIDQAVADDIVEDLQTAWTGDLSGMVERRLIRVLVPYSKTIYFIDGARQYGTAYDMFTKYEEVLNKSEETGRVPLKVVFLPLPRDQLLPALIDGRGDIVAANLTVTPERAEQVDFSTPHHDGVRELVVLAPAEAPVATVDDLSGRRVYTRQSSSYFESLTALNDDFDGRGLAPVDIRLVPEVLEDEDLLEMVDAGLLPAVIVDSHKVTLWHKILKDIVPTDVAIREGGQIAYALRKNSPELLASLNSFLDNYGDKTKFGSIIFQKYWASTKYAKRALKNEDRLRFRGMSDFFQSHGTSYDIDWLMLAAQGYQESRLDPQAESPVGAIGVMQLLPSTAADMGFSDLYDPNENIHAGTKYMRWIMDQYFDDDTLETEEAVFMALASYNAGPNRVARLRKEAAEQGLDPNRWFGNVEQIVARKVSREPIRYVSNIFKYYVAYSEAEDLVETREAAEETLE